MQYQHLYKLILIHTSCKKSATPFLSGHWNPIDLKNSNTCSRGPWYTIWPSEMRIISSNRLYVSGAGWRREITAVPWSMWIDRLRAFTIWYVVELSNPVDISSMNNTLEGPTIISPRTKSVQNVSIYLVIILHESTKHAPRTWRDYNGIPEVTRFLCPPEIPLIMSFPTMVSAQTSSPSNWKKGTQNSDKCQEKHMWN